MVISWCVVFLKLFNSINNNLPKITLSNKSSDAVNLRSFGGYIPSKKEIYIVIANRNLADILRTLAHELVHWKQDLEGRLNENSGQTGSDEENEANSIAGIVLRNYGILEYFGRLDGVFSILQASSLKIMDEAIASML